MAQASALVSDANPRKLAREAGLQVDWVDHEGERRTVAIGVLRAVLDAAGLPAGTDAQCRASLGELTCRGQAEAKRLVTAELGGPIALPGRPGPWQIMLEEGGRREGPAGSVPQPGSVPAGYHRFTAAGWSGTLAVAPRRGWTLEDAGSGCPLAGLAIPLYALRRESEGGNGDFMALAELARRAGSRGIDAPAISPVHALSTAEPSRAAPYTPSSRVARNPAFAPCDIGPSAGAEEELIDWPASPAARLAGLRSDFARDAADPAFAAFRQRAGPALHLHAIFEAISGATVAKSGAADWRRWKVDLATPASVEARRFALEAEDEVAFHLYLQYRAETGLAAAGRAAGQAGMRIGLIADLAVGADPGGSEAWMRQADMLRGLTIGAPPDAFDHEGQAWGLATFSPFALQRSGFSGWIEMLRAALADTAGVRIDHAMGLERLWVIPEGASAKEGVYLSYPAQDLMRLLAVESLRHRAVILAEDLGTLPAGFRERLAEGGMAGLRVLWFERSADGFRPPAGWEKGRDIEWRARLGLPHESPTTRQRDRLLLWHGFRAAGVADGDVPGPSKGGKVATAAVGFLGRTTFRLALLPLEDALAFGEQPNLPGMTEGHPNWRHRLPGTVESMLKRPDVAGRLRALRVGRGGR
jgi:4-alpha-glucanotransferase